MILAALRATIAKHEYTLNESPSKAPVPYEILNLGT